MDSVSDADDRVVDGDERLGHGHRGFPTGDENTSSSGPAMATASAATTAEPFGSSFRSRGWRISNRVPSKPGVMVEATTVPVTLARCMSDLLLLQSGPELGRAVDVCQHLFVELWDDHIGHERLR